MARNLGEFGNVRSSLDIRKMDDIAGQVVTIESYSIITGRTGPYAMMRCVDHDGAEFSVSCGGAFVVEALAEAKAANAFPVEATFTRKGRAWLVE